MSDAPMAAAPGQTPAAPAGAPRSRAVLATAQALWFGLAPAGLAALCFAYLIPARSSADAGRASLLLTHLAADLPIPILLGLFLVFASIARYWRAYLPGAGTAPPAPSAVAQGAKPRWGSALLLAGAAGLAAVAGVVVRTTVIGTYRVVSGSMLPTLDIEDRITVDKMAYGFRVPLTGTALGASLPRRGDLIVFRTSTATGGPTELVKRVVGLPGDYITMDGGRPLINGWKPPTCEVGMFVYLENSGEPTKGRLAVEFLDKQAHLIVLEPLLDSLPGYRVGPREVFVLGDNRGQSIDSRALRPKGGQGMGIPLADIEGRVRRILLGSRRDGRVDLARSWRSLALELHLPGVDVRDLQAGIQKCLANPPASTPPSGELAFDALR